MDANYFFIVFSFVCFVQIFVSFVVKKNGMPDLF